MKRGIPGLATLADSRPLIIGLAGPNGAGKSTFYEAHLRPTGLPLLNADVLGRELELGAYEAARIIAALRDELLQERESFVLETVFSDPVGEKLVFFRQAVELGYTVILCFIGVASLEISQQRVAMRVSQGGHDVPTEKLHSRFPRTLENLSRAILQLPRVLVFDNSELDRPYRLVASFRDGHPALRQPVPAWLAPLL